MPLIKNYSKDNNITDLDYLLGSNGDIGGKTQNYYIKDLKEIFGLNSSASISDIDGLQAALDGKVDDSQVLTNVPENAVFTDTVYTLPFTDNSVNWNAAFGWGDHSGLYSLSGHNHVIDDITGLQTALDALDSNSTGLEELDQGDGNGWRLSARTATPYGPIGLGSVDFSYSTVSGNDFGALGRYSFTGPGFQLTSSGYYSSVFGFNMEAYSFAEIALGTYGTSYVPNSTTAFDASDRVLNIGIGSGDLSRADLLTGFKDGTLTAPSLTTALVDAAGDTSLIHKKYLADKGYLITITEENLGDLYDVSLGTPTTGDLIWYNGLAWNSKSLSEIGISEIGHTHDITDITHEYTLAPGPYTTTVNDYLIKATGIGSTITLHSATGNESKKIIIKNTSLGNITVDTTDSQLIDSASSVVLASNESIEVHSDGSNYIIT